jgi:hypothetical protein
MGEARTSSGYPRVVALALEPAEGCEGCGTPSSTSPRDGSRDEKTKDPYPDPAQIPAFADTAVWIKGLGTREEQGEIDLDVDVDLEEN